MSHEHVDVLIVGAGLSGIGAAYYLQKDHPGRSYAILEARGATERLATALRETWEEVGIPPAAVRVLGVLDDFYSIHNYLVTPYVGVVAADLPLRPNPDEIQRLIEVPLDHLLRPEIFRTEDWSWKGRLHPVHFYTYGNDEIWGLTGRMLKAFLDFVWASI